MNCTESAYQGTLVGLAVGDALGSTLEFKQPGTFEPISDMLGGGPFNLAPGQWTDDTSMALCLAESLIECNGFDATDQMQRYLRWYREGHLSSTGSCFDIGNTVETALQRFEQTNDPFTGLTDPRYGGNGSLMRLAPIALAYVNDPATAIHLAGEMSRTTHAAPEPIDACRYYAGLIVGALTGISKDELMSERYAPLPDIWAKEPLTSRIDKIAAGSFKHKEPPSIQGRGYVVDGLEAALWAFWKSESFVEGALLAVNLGHDADTTGAIYGQLAGAYYTLPEIPVKWRECLAYGSYIEGVASQLMQFDQSAVGRENKMDKPWFG